MPLPRRTPNFKAIIRAHSDDPASRTVHVQIDQDGGVQSEAAGGDVHQAVDSDNAFPAGFYCAQMAGDEEVKVKSAGSWLVIAVRLDIPSDVKSARVREPVLWDPSGNRIRCNGSDGPEVTVGAGKCKIRSKDASTKKVALDQDTVVATEDFMTWCAGVAAAASYTPPEDSNIATVSASAAKLEAE